MGIRIVSTTTIIHYITYKIIKEKIKFKNMHKIVLVNILSQIGVRFIWSHASLREYWQFMATERWGWELVTFFSGIVPDKLHSYSK